MSTFEPQIETSVFRSSSDSRKSEYVLKMTLDEALFDAIESNEGYGIISKMADRIAEDLYPDVKAKIMESPGFKDIIVSEVLTRLARLSKEGLSTGDNTEEGS